MTEKQQAFHHGDCPFIGPVSELKVQVQHITKAVDELKEDMEEIKKALSSIKSLSDSQILFEKAVERAFLKIDTHEKIIQEHEKALNQFYGMKTLAVGLWTVLAGGLGVVLLKVFSL